MKKIRFITIFALLILFNLVTNADIKERIKINSILNNIQQYHFNPKPIDDKLSNEIFNLYLKRLDPNKQFFIQEDIDKLKTFEFLIDDQIKNNTYTFQQLTQHLLKKRIKKIKTIYPIILGKQFNLFKNETVTINRKDASFFNSEKALENYWHKFLKYQTTAEYIQLLDKKKISTKNRTVFQKKLEKDARKSILESTKKYIERLEQETEDEQFASYLDSISNAFDPHTTYLLPSSKEDFDISITGKLEGIGAVLREDDGYIKVIRIVSGSASWKQKELATEDIILKVGQGDEEPVNIEGARVRDAVNLIRGKKGTEVRLTVKKPDGSIKIIPIIRDVVIIEETYAKSTIIEHKTLNKKFGYIKLPGFYRDFKDSTARNSSTDVKKELESLIKKNIDGVILDLRNNGGGALNDAVDMSGLFLRTGPIVQVKNRFNQGPVLADYNPDITYDGPLTILINSFSASASEILAAALQDYNRAIIIGSDHSYGKGTVQTFLELDKNIPQQFKNLKPFGSLKLTIQKFYRINGESTQYKGVIPDIQMPFSTDYIKTGEKTLEHSLNWSQVDSVRYAQSNRHLTTLKSITENSQKRIRENKYFNNLTSLTALKKARQNKKSQELNLTTWLSANRDYEKQINSFKLKLTTNTELKIATQNLTVDDIDKNKEWFKEITKDPYIFESILVTNDLISTLK